MRISASAKSTSCLRPFPAAVDGMGHARGSPWLPDGLVQRQSHSKSENFPGHAPDRQSSGLRIINRIRVGTVDEWPDVRGAEGEIARMPGQALGIEEPGDVDSSIESRTSTIDRGPSLSNPGPRSDLRPKLLCGFRLPSGRGLLVPRSRAIALLEAGAAAGVASFLEGRCEVIAAAISAHQLLHTGPCSR